jgi:hypothetical protein
VRAGHRKARRLSSDSVQIGGQVRLRSRNDKDFGASIPASWKGYSGYGTMLVDWEQGVVADLLPDRSAAAFQKWLRKHPEVRIISRDRDRVYAEGG